MVKHVKTEIVHLGVKGGVTACNEDTKKHPTHWEDTIDAINCEKCKNSIK